MLGHRRDTVDLLLTVAGWVLVAGLVASTFHHSSSFVRELARAAKIGGPFDVDGPLRVRGDLYVGGPATIHGQVQARKLTIGGPVTDTLPRGEQPGPDGRVFETSLAVGGPLTVQGPLIVDGALVVGGPLHSEPSH